MGLEIEMVGWLGKIFISIFFFKKSEKKNFFFNLSNLKTKF
jgi:hypothetical protein